MLPGNNQRGVALIIVLWVSVILVGIVLAGAYSARLEMRMAYYPAQELQAIALARAGVEAAALHLETRALRGHSQECFAPPGVMGTVIPLRGATKTLDMLRKRHIETTSGHGAEFIAMVIPVWTWTLFHRSGLIFNHEISVRVKMKLGGAMKSSQITEII